MDCCEFDQCKRGFNCPLRQPISHDGGEQVEDGMRIQMFNSYAPSPFEYFYDACDWVQSNFFYILVAFGVVAIAAVIALSFWR